MACRRFAVQGSAFQIALCVLLLLTIGVPAGLAAPPQPEARGPARGMWAGGVYEDIAVDASPMAARASSAGALGSARRVRRFVAEPLDAGRGRRATTSSRPPTRGRSRPGSSSISSRWQKTATSISRWRPNRTYVAAGATAVRHGSFYDLEKNHTYYWRVASVCADGQIGPFSTPSSFTTGGGSGNPPCNRPPPTLQAPADGRSWRRWFHSTPGGACRGRGSMCSSAQRTRVQRRGLNALLQRRPRVPRGDLHQQSEPAPESDLLLARGERVRRDRYSGRLFGGLCYRTGPVERTAFPSTPALIAPANGVTTASIRVTLMYGSVPGADMYNVRRSMFSVGSPTRSPITPITTTRRASTTVIDVSNPETTALPAREVLNGYGWGGPVGDSHASDAQPDASTTITRRRAAHSGRSAGSSG